MTSVVNVYAIACRPRIRVRALYAMCHSLPQSSLVALSLPNRFETSFKRTRWSAVIRMPRGSRIARRLLY